MKTILITGGSGLIGSQLTKLLTMKGFQVRWLTRKINPLETTPQFVWDWKNKSIDTDAFLGVDAIIHLAGASINGKRWTSQVKQDIYDSRVVATQFLFESLAKEKHQVKTIVAGSAVGYYGAVTVDKIFFEDDAAGTDFLAKTCNDWEQTSEQFSSLGIRTVIIRTGIVLSKESETFKKIAAPIRFGMGSGLGSGKQIFPWIHLADLCGIMLKSLDDESMQGAYNAVAPESITNLALMKELAKAMKKPFFMPKIPSFIIKLLFGELADALLNGSKISAEKVIKSGYKFQFSNFQEATKSFIN
ncbi:MAG: TIGR01777 family oxidoreductase [Bacteroidota bacterium]